MTLRANRPVVVRVGLDAGYALKPQQIVPIAVTTDYRRHTIAFGEFGSADLSRVRAGRQVAEIGLAGRAITA